MLTTRYGPLAWYRKGPRGKVVRVHAGSPVTVIMITRLIFLFNHHYCTWAVPKKLLASSTVCLVKISLRNLYISLHLRVVDTIPLRLTRKLIMASTKSYASLDMVLALLHGSFHVLRLTNRDTLRWRSLLLLLQSVQKPWSFLSWRKSTKSVVRAPSSFQDFTTVSGKKQPWEGIFALLWTHWAPPLGICNVMPTTSASPFTRCSELCF